eukprot:TRINITY_DN13782_c0_g1_i6.p1 TRINITY_DN13782_c0_g1~~TRINITY_DN13782_c0_g1_i6.p1  ORF type:complete len:752 (+),score=157.78 TRINITY_DN13782_c0_g1_i6:66-2321(+)
MAFLRNLFAERQPEQPAPQAAGPSGGSSLPSVDAFVNSAPSAPSSGRPVQPAASCEEALRLAKVQHLYDLNQELSRCILSWKCSAEQAFVSISAVLATNDGLVLGSVHGLLREHAANVDNQFRECGVTHDGTTGPGASGEGTITLQLDKLAAAALVDMVFLTVELESQQASFGDLDELMLDLFVNSRRLGQVNILGDAQVAVCKRAVLAVLVKNVDGTNWQVALLCAPVPASSRSEGISGGSGGLPEELTSGLAQAVLRARREKSQQRAAGEVAATLRSERARIARLVDTGDIPEARKAQEALIEKLMDTPSGGLTQGGDDEGEDVLAREFRRLEDLQRLEEADGPSSTGASSSTGPYPTGAGSSAAASRPAISPQEAEELARIETLDEEGYQSIVALKQERALARFIKRAADKHDIRACREGDIGTIAQSHTADSGARSYDVLLEQLRACSAALTPPASFELPDEPFGGTSNQVEQDAAGAGRADEGRHDAMETQPVEQQPGSSTGPPADQNAAEAPVPSGEKEPAATEEVLEPQHGSIHGGTQVRWVGAEPAPLELSIAGRPCAALSGGIFVVPLLRAGRNGSVNSGLQTVFAAFPDGSEKEYPRAFNYWEPGVFKTVSPPRGPLPGGTRVRVSTSDLGATIETVLFDGVSAELTWRGASEAEAILPARHTEGSVAIEVHASNGNIATSDTEVFGYYAPSIFGGIGENVSMSDDGATVARDKGANCSVCIGSTSCILFTRLSRRFLTER